MLFENITMINYSRPLRERAKARKFAGPYTWSPSKPGNGRGFYQASSGLSCDARGSTFDLRLEYAHTFIPTHRSYRLPQGYYCDRDGDQTLTPIVARLPRGRGFLAGWTMGEGMCASLDAYIYQDGESAADAAYSMAESDAEKAREADDNEGED